MLIQSWDTRNSLKNQMAQRLTNKIESQNYRDLWIAIQIHPLTDLKGVIVLLLLHLLLVAFQLKSGFWSNSLDHNRIPFRHSNGHQRQKERPYILADNSDRVISPRIEGVVFPDSWYFYSFPWRSGRKKGGRKEAECSGEAEVGMRQLPSEGVDLNSDPEEVVEESAHFCDVEEVGGRERNECPEPS